MGIKGTRRKIWNEELIVDLYNNSKPVILQQDDVEYYSSLASQIKGDFKIDFSLSCKHLSKLHLVIECNKCGYRAYRSKYQIIKKQHECYGCCVNNIRNKCESKNYDLIDYLPFSDKSLVSCKNCGDTFEVLKSAILGKNNIDCESCRIIKYKKYCKIKNSEYVSHRRVKNGILVSVKCLLCGSVEEKASSSVISDKEYVFDCSNCQHMKYETSIKHTDFSFIGNVDEVYCTISCKTHKNTLCVCRSTVRQGLKGYKCPDCVEDRIRNRLSSKGCTYISHTSNKTKYIGIDGTEFIRSNGSVYSGRFPVSISNRRNQPYKLYMICVNYMGNNFLKVGIATDPEIRFKSLGLHTNASLHVLKEFDTGSAAQAVEYGLFKRFRKFKLCSTIPETFCSGISRNKTDGATEWLDYHVLSQNFYGVLDDLCSNA